MTMIAAEYLRAETEQVQFELGDTKFPKAPSQGGSQQFSSVGSAIYAPRSTIGAKLLEHANKDAASPLKDAAAADIEMLDGRLQLKSDPSRFVAHRRCDEAQSSHRDHRDFDSKPSPERQKFALLAHGGAVRGSEGGSRTSARRRHTRHRDHGLRQDHQPKASHSQEIGGVVWGIGMACRKRPRSTTATAAS
jgi:xanthine dehydrogenase YagR molybdenum-binding subunit